MYRLIGVRLSPATEKAVWTLDHARAAYVFKEYIPTVTTPLVRLRIGKLRGSFTVPIVLGPNGVKLFDSIDIARHFAEEVPQSGLIPPDRREDVEAINAASHEIIYAGRLRAIPPTLANEKALQEALPPFVPDALRPAAMPVAVRAFKYLAKKYPKPGATDDDLAQTMREGLVQMRQWLDGKPYILGAFSYADILLATTLQLVRPLVWEHMQLGVETARCWTRPELAEEFGDLLAWRDDVYRDCRFTA